ncbi:MAG: hypothetical protein QM715_18535 [Nibricoccus sp.]
MNLPFSRGTRIGIFTVIATTFWSATGLKAASPGLEKLAEAAAPQSSFSLTPGVDYLAGKYGMKSKTEICIASLTGEYTFRDWTIRAYVPYLSVKSPGGTTIIDGRPVQTLGGATQSAVLKKLGLTLAQLKILTPQQRQTQIDAATTNSSTETNSGIGDAELSLDYTLYSDSATGWNVDLTGTVKFGTGKEEKGLGTGETDYRVSAEVSRSIGKFTPVVSFGYCIMGKPEDSDLRNYFFGRASAIYSPTYDTDLSLTFSAAQRSSESTGADNELILVASHNVGKSWNVEGHVLAGLSTSAPDFGVGASARYSF